MILIIKLWSSLRVKTSPSLPKPAACLNDSVMMRICDDQSSPLPLMFLRSPDLGQEETQGSRAAWLGWCISDPPHWCWACHGLFTVHSLQNQGICHRQLPSVQKWSVFSGRALIPLPHPQASRYAPSPVLFLWCLHASKWLWWARFKKIPWRITHVDIHRTKESSSNHPSIYPTH